MGLPYSSSGDFAWIDSFSTYWCRDRPEGLYINEQDGISGAIRAGKQSIFIVLQTAKSLTVDNPSQQQRLDKIETFVDLKLNELTQTIELLKAGNRAEALDLINTNRYVRERDIAELRLKKTVKELEQSLSEIQTLEGIIRICSYCHNVCKMDGPWDKLESYIGRHTDAKFSHGICPVCIIKVRAEEGLD